MKEITFSELLKPHKKRLDWNNKNRIWIDYADVLNILQQVREATIAECVEILRNPNIPKSRMESLPTDRIKINL